MFPTLLKTSYFTVHSIWFFTAIAFITGTIVFIRLAQRNKLKIEMITNHSIFITIMAIVGGRLFFIFERPNLFFQPDVEVILSIFKFWDKGLSIWGILLFFLISIWILAKKYQENLLKWLDVISIAFIFGAIPGHIGALLQGNIYYGRPTNMPWGVTFDTAEIQYVVPIHPTQLYGLVFSLGLFMVLYFHIFPKLKEVEPGKTALIGVFSFSIFRFLNEFFRGDFVQTINLGVEIRMPMILSLLTAILAGFILKKGINYMYLKIGKLKKKIKGSN